MQWHEAFFSQKPFYRLLRHTVFWAVWWLYFSVSFYLYGQPFNGSIKPGFVTVGSHLAIKTFLLIVLSAVSCYTFIYFILPQFLKGKRLNPWVNLLLLGGLLFAAGHFMYWTVFPFVDSLFGPYKANRFFTRYWPAVSLGLIEPLKVVAAAGIIKYVKYGWLKKRESERLEKEKIDAELQLLKAQIHPHFLLTSLNHIYAYSLTASLRAPELLLKLSDLLSYMLYECDEPLVPLEKEMAMMREYMALEKMGLHEAIEMELAIRGDMTGKMIAPFLLLPFIENGFIQSSRLTEQAWMNLDISIEGNAFSMKLANGIRHDDTGSGVFEESGLANVQKRLTLIYPQQHELKLIREREMLLVFLKITLGESAVVNPALDETLLFTESANHQPKLYVS